jgi:alkylation response protein AidB-like acyl-CoA dehydrogenase
MDFGLNEQQEMMQTMARDFLTTEFTDKVLKAMAKDEKGYTLELWKKLAEANLTGLAIPEQYGGVGDFLDLIIVLEEMGRACFIAPYFASVVLGAGTIVEAGNDAQKKEFLPKIAEGKIIVTLALPEQSGKYTADAIKMKAVKKGNDYILDGTKLFVPDAHNADYILVAARTSEGKNPQEGLSLFIVDAKSSGMKITPLETVGGDKQAEIIFTHVAVPAANILGVIDKAWTAIEKIIQKAAVARCAEMVGLAQKVLDISLDYVKERMAFGHPIGAFQAIQHRCADMLIDLDGSRYVTYQAAWRINENLPSAREAAIAKVWVCQSCKRIVHSAHQVHGAIGFTEDHILHYYTKRVRSYEFSFGDVNSNLEKLVAYKS